VSNANIENGCFVATATNYDPAIGSSLTGLDTRTYPEVEIRMKVDKGSEGQLFWSGRGYDLSESASVRFALTADGEFHTYKLDLTTCQAWRGNITGLRFDPTDKEGAHIAVDSIRFIKKP
jgi:hypothetical protein